MRILVLNWRDPRNPHAGGAELFTHEVAKRLVAGGDEVEWFSAMYPGALSTEQIDGVTIVRSGRQSTVHLHAIRRYYKKLRSRFDVVIDEVNTIPFFTPLWADIPAFMLIHQLARNVWWYESRFPINAFGYMMEPLYLRIYKNTPVFTVSPSTEGDLRRLHFKGPITVVPEGIEPIEAVSTTKETVPTCLYVGRVSPSKRVHEIVRAFASFRGTVGAGKLWIVGDGPAAYLSRLRRLADRLDIADDVTFWGRTPTHEKHRLMAAAHFLLLASVREGFGLVVLEANALGTPAIAYDVHGLRDAVWHEETGLLVEGTPSNLASAMLRAWRSPGLLDRLSSGALMWSRRFSFDLSASAIRCRIGEQIHRHKEEQATLPTVRPE